MKNHFLRTMVICFVLAIAIGMLAGCETCKGVGRDVKGLDAWMKDNLW